MVASRFAPGRVDEAEMAYKEYLAVESDPVKVSVAESNLAALLYRSGQWEKARVAYQRVLNRNPRNTEALARLTGIMRAIAKNQESAGELTEAKKSTEAADAYSERLQEVEVDRAIKYGDTLLRDRTVDTTRAVEKPTVGDKAAVKPAGDAKRPEPKPARIRP
jgi:tetratricopeptide (TPR) repeat protein